MNLNMAVNIAAGLMTVMGIIGIAWGIATPHEPSKYILGERGELKKQRMRLGGIALGFGVLVFCLNLFISS
jgi:hypothetical protein